LAAQFIPNPSLPPSLPGVWFQYSFAKPLSFPYGFHSIAVQVYTIRDSVALLQPTFFFAGQLS
jgi:hypothetical protein